MDFTKLNASLPGAFAGSVDSADYDKDGDLDFLVTGYDASLNKIAKVYNNNGSGSFTANTSISLPGVYSSSVDSADYDKDGDIDLLITGNDGINQIAKVYKNNGSGNFSTNTSISLPGVSSGSVDSADYDKDGDLDLLITAGGNSAKIYKNDGSGNFSTNNTISLPSVWYSSIDSADYDKDGDLDLLITGQNSSGVTAKIYNNNGSASFTENTNISLPGVRYSSVDWGDYNGDNKLDFIIAGQTTNNSYITKIYQNNGSSGFTENTSVFLPGIIRGSVDSEDYDKDGDLDLLITGVSNSDFTAKIYKNGGSGNFTADTSVSLTGVWQSAADSADYDKDGDLDLLITGKDSNNTPIADIYRNDLAVAPRNLKENTNISLTGVGNSSVDWADYDKDGDLDLLITGQGSGNNLVAKIYNNNGSGSFSENTNVSLPGIYRGSVESADYDKDGDLDLLITGHSSNTRIAKIYNNNGSGSFSENTNISLPGVYNSSVDWADYDKDGDLDLLITGRDMGNLPIAKIYNNNGSGNFSLNTNVSLPNVFFGSVDSADYDSDGDLDLLITGQDNSNNRIAKIYNNNGSGSFSLNTNVSLPGVSISSVDSADYDSDGDLDLLITGQDNSNLPIANIYNNNGSGNFSLNTNVSLPSVYYSSVDSADYDKDGDLDLLITGQGSNNRIANIYNNDGSGNFSLNTNVSLTSVYASSVDSADYDKDGDFDVLITGYSGSSFIAKIYNNTIIPTAISLTSTTVAENQAVGTIVGNLSTTDGDSTQFTYSLVSGTGSTNNSSFTINGNQLKTAASFDFETKSSYSIRLQTTDEVGNTFSNPFTISINNLNETPTNLSLSNTNINENVVANTVVGNLTSTDPDTGDIFTYSLVSGIGSTDNSAFTIAGNQLKINSSPDFETKSSYNLRVKTTDAGGLNYEKQLTINVNNLNEIPTDLSLSATSINENILANSVVGTFTTTDPDTGNTFTYSLVSGTGDTDNAAFTIAGNQLKINSSPDFETKSSYNIRVKTTDGGGLNYEKQLTVNVNNLNETPTNLSLSNTSINENVAANTLVGNLTSTDPDTDNTFTYSLVSGTGDTDNDSFTIVDDQLKINASTDFEAKSSYNLRVKTTDAGGLSYEKELTININDLNEAPTDLTLSATSVNENVIANTLVANLTSTDPDTGDTFTYSLVSGTGDTDNDSFSIVDDQLKINVSPDFEAKFSYNLRVKTTDADNLSYEKELTININDLVENQNPTDLTLSATSINENLVANSVVGTLATTDPNAGDTYTYSLVSGTGSTDNAAFTIVDNQLKINASPDFEAKSSYNLRVKTTDAGNLSYEKELTINVNNLNEAPTDLTLSATSINENVAANTVIGNITSTDPDTGNTFTYSLVPGTGSTDNSAFAISGNQLKINASPDFEAKSSYNLRVKTTDAGNLSYEKELTINVNNLNEIIGTNGRDNLNGTNSDDDMFALDGDDTLNGSLGADTLRGGAGIDRVIYSSSPTAVNVNLITGLGTGGHAQGDIYDSIENIDGSRFDDFLIGDINNNAFYAGRGNDPLQGNGGNDYLNGENGNDSLVGGDGLDKLYGGSENDTLTGDAGSDTLNGGIHSDRLLGTNSTNKGVGESDRLTGDTGNDTFVLGTSTVSFYDDGNNANKGIADYASISDFSFQDDVVELSGSQNYYLGTNPINTPAGTGIFIDNDGISGFSSKDELIAILENITTANGLAITNTTTGFSLLS